MSEYNYQKSLLSFFMSLRLCDSATKKLVVMWSCRLVDFFYLCNYEKNLPIYKSVSSSESVSESVSASVSHIHFDVEFYAMRQCGVANGWS